MPSSQPIYAEDSGGTTFPVAMGIAAAAALALRWVNAAVGIMGDGSVNLLYLGVLVVGIATEIQLIRPGIGRRRSDCRSFPSRKTTEWCSGR